MGPIAAIRYLYMYVQYISCVHGGLKASGKIVGKYLISGTDESSRGCIVKLKVHNSIFRLLSAC